MTAETSDQLPALLPTIQKSKILLSIFFYISFVTLI